MKQQTSVPTDIKPLNYKELRALYDVTHKTLKSWLASFMAEIGVMRGKSFTVRQMRVIYSRLGNPKSED